MNSNNSNSRYTTVSRAMTVGTSQTLTAERTPAIPGMPASVYKGTPTTVVASAGMSTTVSNLSFTQKKLFKGKMES
jgi:hypothetical protein